MTFLSRRLFRRVSNQVNIRQKLSRRVNPEHLERRDTPAAFTPGNRAPFRAGYAATSLAATGHPVFLDELTRTGSLVQTIAMPSTGAGPYLVGAGNATSEGLLSLSGDGKFLALAGYNQSLPNAVSLPGTL